MISKYKSNKKIATKNSVYKKLGIKDVNAFYADKFVWQHGPNIVEQVPNSRFSIQYLKPYWIFDHIREGTTVLDVGCGSGTLNLLKSKNVFLVGTDLSEKGLQQSLLAGYDRAILCDSYDIPYPDKSFDYIVSLDLLGHIENDVKDIYLSEWVRLLKDEGVMLHGLETGDIDYDNITDEVRRHVSIDGHVGLESFQSVVKRFNKFFRDVTPENCMGPCYNWYDIQKYEITENPIGKEFRDYLLTFKLDQINAFNAAMLLMRKILVKEKLMGETGGFMFIKAQNKVGTKLIKD